MLYRLVQELLNNTIKYAQATQIQITVQKQENQLTLLYIDNGRGFDFDEAYRKKSLGLKNIETRARMFDGTLQFITQPNQGTKVTVNVPLSA